MTPSEFKTKWDRYRGKETSAYQEHFNDLCRMLGQPTPAEADPSGNDWFCFQKYVVKDLELAGAAKSSADPEQKRRGFADVWRKDCFGWEYKGKHANLDEAHKQLLRYRESLLNPPLLVTCDFNRFVIRTNFNGTVLEVHEFPNDRIDEPRNLRLLRALFDRPTDLKPTQTTAKVTEDLAEAIATVARSLQGREAVELSDARNRREVTVAQKKNLRIARFLNRIVFCLFAEDTALLPQKLLHGVLKQSYDDPAYFAPALESLFRAMATGGLYGPHPIRHFNGHLFEDTTVFELTPGEIAQLAIAAESDWRSIQPSIMGTLFERALEPEQRAQLGAHYTSEADIDTLVEPVLMAPLRREWRELKRSLAASFAKGRGAKTDRERLAAFQKKLANTTVLDPACGSGNFLYVALRLLLDLEKEVCTFAAQLAFSLPLKVDVTQLRAIEINPYAYELAQVSVQIGALQWRRDNGYDNDRTPVLRTLDGFENKDALLRETFRKQPKSLKEARAEEHANQDELFRVFHERAWPDADIIVGNPPFLGGKLLRRELGDEYVEALFENYGERVRPEADLCCYWFAKACEQIAAGKTRRAGLLATQGIRGGANRETLKRIKKTGDIFFAESDRKWVLGGANVHVSMIGFDRGEEPERVLDGKPVPTINSNLSAAADTTRAVRLGALTGIAFMGDTKGGAFDVDEAPVLRWLKQPNPHGSPNSDVLVPWANGLVVTRRMPPIWIIDFGQRSEVEAANYAAPFDHVREHVLPERRKNKRETYAKHWWRHVEARPAMLRALNGRPRFLASVAVSKHRLFAWLEQPLLPDHQLFAFANSEDWFFGILHSRVHEAWARAQGTQVLERESGFRYTATTCFETFPFPFELRPPPPAPTQADVDAAHHYFMAKEDAAPYGAEAMHRTAIASAAKELNELRERWL
ncbi:MAG: DNA methyltransferase, partial [Opitutaceae bacterium]